MQQSAVNLDDGDEPKRVQTTILTPLEKTERQLALLCRTFGSVAQYAGDSKSMEGMDVPVELQKKATDTCIKALYQIDNLLDDMPRWSIGHSVVEKHYAHLLEHAANLQEAQAMKARLETLPSSRLPVHLHEYSEGRWGAYLVQHGKAVLVGSGPTINDALNDFNLKALEGEKPSRQRKKKAPRKLDGPKDQPSTGPA